VWRPDPHHTQEKAESEKVRYGGLGGASRPHHTQEKAESEKAGMADWVRRVQTPYSHTREGREREGEVGRASRPPPHKEKAESEKEV
jgi:hypothetical protein